MTQITENNTREAGVNMREARFNMREARFNMIEQQIRTWDVLDPVVLQLLNDVPREHFVPPAYLGLAFADIEIPLAPTLSTGQSMLSPKLEGRILQALQLQKTQHVLHIGTGSGYFTALLATLAQHVVAIEIDEKLSAQAAQNLAKHHIQNVRLEVTDALLDIDTNAQYEVIVLTGSCPVEPAGLRQQLAIGGSMFVVLGTAPAMQATLIKRVSALQFKQEVLFETCIPPLMYAPQAAQFEF